MSSESQRRHALKCCLAEFKSRMCAQDEQYWARLYSLAAANGGGSDAYIDAAKKSRELPGKLTADLLVAIAEYLLDLEKESECQSSNLPPTSEK